MSGSGAPHLALGHPGGPGAKPPDRLARQAQNGDQRQRHRTLQHSYPDPGRSEPRRPPGTTSRQASPCRMPSPRAPTVCWDELLNEMFFTSVASSASRSDAGGPITTAARSHLQLGWKIPSEFTSACHRAGIRRCAMPKAPRQLPSLPPPNCANPAARANSGLDKTWRQGQGADRGVMDTLFRTPTSSVGFVGFATQAYLPKHSLCLGDRIAESNNSLFSSAAISQIGTTFEVRCEAARGSHPGVMSRIFPMTWRRAFHVCQREIVGRNGKWFRVWQGIDSCRPER